MLRSAIQATRWPSDCIWASRRRHSPVRGGAAADISWQVMWANNTGSSRTKFRSPPVNARCGLCYIRSLYILCSLYSCYVLHYTWYLWCDIVGAAVRIVRPLRDIAGRDSSLCCCAVVLSVKMVTLTIRRRNFTTMTAVLPWILTFASFNCVFRIMEIGLKLSVLT